MSLIVNLAFILLTWNITLPDEIKHWGNIFSQEFETLKIKASPVNYCISYGKIAFLDISDIFHENLCYKIPFHKVYDISNSLRRPERKLDRCFYNEQKRQEIFSEEQANDGKVPPGKSFLMVLQIKLFVESFIQVCTVIDSGVRIL